MIQWCVLSQESESRHDSTDIAEADDPGGANASVYVALEAHQVPTDDDGTRGESAHSNETESGVLC